MRDGIIRKSMQKVVPKRGVQITLLYGSRTAKERTAKEAVLMTDNIQKSTNSCQQLYSVTLL